jgi:MerR family transcriptional regulator, thiopeptide resistance regulator
METIGRLGRRFGISRSTLLYYDRIGLLRASSRSGASYRSYSEADVRRLELIRLYRAAGVPLADIRRILDSPREALAEALERRLEVLHAELVRIRAQQDVIIRILRRPDLARRHRGLDQRGWVSLLRAVGIDEPGMLRWHAEFERMAPEAHQDFLESLRIPAATAQNIRRMARRGQGQ